MNRPLTVVALHAHPDDESLLTGGTLARAAAEGHRVVLVCATRGEAGGPGELRFQELCTAASALGCARVAELGYADSGLRGDALPSRPADPRLPSTAPPPDAADPPLPGTAPLPGEADPLLPGTAPPPGEAVAGRRFVDVPVEEAAARVAEILREENADALIGYDRRGGYGHPDHVHVHHVARRAAALAGTRLLLEATVDRHRLRLALGLLRVGGRLLPRLPLDGVAEAFTPHEQITHAVDVRPWSRRKRAALRAHRSQARGRGIRTVALLGRLPLPLFGVVAGREWYVEPGRSPGRKPAADPFASLR